MASLRNFRRVISRDISPSPLSPFRSCAISATQFYLADTNFETTLLSFFFFFFLFFFFLFQRMNYNCDDRRGRRVFALHRRCAVVCVDIVGEGLLDYWWLTTLVDSRIIKFPRLSWPFRYVKRQSRIYIYIYKTSFLRNVTQLRRLLFFFFNPWNIRECLTTFSLHSRRIIEIFIEASSFISTINRHVKKKKSNHDILT